MPNLPFEDRRLCKNLQILIIASLKYIITQINNYVFDLMEDYKMTSLKSSCQYT